VILGRWGEIEPVLHFAIGARQAPIGRRYCEPAFHHLEYGSVPNKGEADMGDTGKKDKGKREVQKKAKLTLMEKRKQKQDKKSAK